MGDNDVSADQTTGRVVAIVPHTHWDRECSGVQTHQRIRSGHDR